MPCIFSGSGMTGSEAKEFLRKLDESDRVTVSDWEAKFIESNLDRDYFTDKQVEIVEKMVSKYGAKIGW